MYKEDVRSILKIVFYDKSKEFQKGILGSQVDFKSRRESVSLYFDHRAFKCLVFNGVEVRLVK